MDGITGTFDATLYDPTQSMPAHPVGKFLATIAETDIKPTKEANGGYLEVTFQTDAGRAVMRYNIWNQNQVAADIAHRQLSALCYVTGIFKLDWANKGAALKGARCGIEVVKQPGNENYTQVAAVMDVNGNLPSKQQPAQQAEAARFQPQPNPAQAQSQPAAAANPWAKPAVDAPGAASPVQGFQPQPQPAQGFQQQPQSQQQGGSTPPWATR